MKGKIMTKKMKVALNLRIPSELKDHLDEAVERFNKTVPVPVNRNQLATYLLEQGLAKFEFKGKASK